MSIRVAVPQDIPAMLKIYGYFVRETATSFEYEVPSQEEFLHRFHTYSATYPWLVWEEEGKVLGYAYASRPFARAAYAWNAEISCYLHACARGRGVGRRLYAELEKSLRAMGIRKVFAVVTSANEGSIAFHRAIGYRDCARFTDVGYKLGAWYDVIWLEKQLQPLGRPV